MKMPKEKDHIRECRICHLFFTTNRKNQKICFRRECKREWNNIRSAFWRLNNPTYHREYMRRYRRIGKEVGHVQKGLIAYYTDQLGEAKKQFGLALEVFRSSETRLTIPEKRDMEMCQKRIREINKRLEVEL